MGRKYHLLIVMTVGLFFVAGCNERTQPSESQDTVFPQTTQSAGSLNVAAPQPSQPALAPQEQPPVSQAPAATEIQPPAIAIPTTTDIQQALKNAGLYGGEIDGKIGPKTMKAIEDFQAKNNLKVDGVVGPATWEKLKSSQNVSNQPEQTGIGD